MWRSPHRCRSLPEAGWGSERDRDPGKQCPRGRYSESQPCLRTPRNLDRPSSRCCIRTPSPLHALPGATRLGSGRPAETKRTTVSINLFSTQVSTQNQAGSQVYTVLYINTSHNDWVEIRFRPVKHQIHTHGYI